MPEHSIRTWAIGSRAVLIAIVPWVSLALLLAVEGQIASHLRGERQPWWPSFAYSLAIFSVWVALTPAIARAVRLVEAKRRPLSVRLVGFALGLPVVAALHVGLFAAIYWPIYSDGGRIPDRWSMAETMFARNLDLNSLLYVIVVGATLFRLRKRRSSEGPPQALHGSRSPADPIRVRIEGGLVFVAPEDIDWLGAAGDYVEIHTGSRTLLADGTLAALAERLPSGAFARIHRGNVVRIDRIAEIRSAGRGDGVVLLRDGTELRLSRRYRTNLAALLRNENAR